MIVTKLEYKEPSRLKSWISIDQIENDMDGVIFMNKVGDVLFTNKYNEKSKEFARSILDFLIGWEFITWKQYDSLMAIREEGKKVPVVMTRDKDKKGYYYINEGSNYINVKNSKLSFTVRTGVIQADSILGFEISSAKTDRDFDRIYEKIFGEAPCFEENEEGYDTSYDKEGQRYFSFAEADDYTFPLIDPVGEGIMRSILKM